MTGLIPYWIFKIEVFTQQHSIHVFVHKNMVLWKYSSVSLKTWILIKSFKIVVNWSKWNVWLNDKFLYLNSGDYGTVDEDLFGAPIPIRAVVSYSWSVCLNSSFHYGSQVDEEFGDRKGVHFFVQRKGVHLFVQMKEVHLVVQRTCTHRKHQKCI